MTPSCRDVTVPVNNSESPSSRMDALTSTASLAPALEITADSPRRFINRELSWLAFNMRVLEEASNPRHPLLERVRFLSISAGNLDEFYMVRVAGLVDMLPTRSTLLSDDGLTPGRAARRDPRARLDPDGPASRRSGPACRTSCARPASPSSSRRELTDAERTWLETYFIDQVFPILTPLAIDPAHPFPVHPQRRLLDDPEAAAPGRPAAADGAAAAAAAGRPLRAPAGQRRSASCRSRSWSTIFLPRLFPGYEVIERGCLPPDPRQRRRDQRGGRGSGAALRERAEAPPPRRPDLDLGRQPPCRPSCATSCSTSSRSRPDPIVHVFDLDRMLNIGDVKAVIVDDRPDLKFAPYNAALPRAHPRLRRRLLRRHPRQGHRRPPSLRELRRRGAVPAPGGARSRRGGDQADALPHLGQFADRQGADRGGRGRQDGDGAGRAQGALRRGGQHPLGARPRARRRAGGLRLHRPQDPRQGLDGGAARGAGDCAPTCISAPATTIRSRRASTPTCRSSPAIRRWAATPRGCSTT